MWQELSRIALLGTERAEITPEIKQMLADYGIKTGKDDQETLLKAAAFFAQMQKIGFSIDDFEGELPDSDDSEPEKYCDEQLLRFFTVILKIKTYSNIAEEFFFYLKKFNLKLAPEIIPQLFGNKSILTYVLSAHSSIFPKRGYWLARQKLSWVKNISIVEDLGKQNVIIENFEQKWIDENPERFKDIASHLFVLPKKVRLRKTIEILSSEKIMSALKEDGSLSDIPKKIRNSRKFPLKFIIENTEPSYWEDILKEKPKKILKEVFNIRNANSKIIISAFIDAVIYFDDKNWKMAILQIFFSNNFTHLYSDIYNRFFSKGISYEFFEEYGIKLIMSYDTTTYWEFLYRIFQENKFLWSSRMTKLFFEKVTNVLMQQSYKDKRFLMIAENAKFYCDLDVFSQFEDKIYNVFMYSGFRGKSSFFGILNFRRDMIDEFNNRR